MKNWTFIDNEWKLVKGGKVPRLLVLDEEGMRAFHTPPFDKWPKLFEDEDEGKG